MNAEPCAGNFVEDKARVLRQLSCLSSSQMGVDTSILAKEHCGVCIKLMESLKFHRLCGFPSASDEASVTTVSSRDAW